MRTYSQRNEDRKADSLIGKAVGVGSLAALFVLGKPFLPSIGTDITKQILRGMAKAEEKIFKGSVTSVRNSILARSIRSEENFLLRDTFIGNETESFRRLINYGAQLQNQREEVVERLVTTHGWERAHAERLLEYSNKSVDLLHSKDVSRSLEDPYYRKIIEGIEGDIKGPVDREKLLSHVHDAVTNSHRLPVDDDVSAELNRGFLARIRRYQTQAASNIVHPKIGLDALDVPHKGIWGAVRKYAVAPFRKFIEKNKGLVGIEDVTVADTVGDDFLDTLRKSFVAVSKSKVPGVTPTKEYSLFQKEIKDHLEKIS